MWLGRVVRALLRAIGKNTYSFADRRGLSSVSDGTALFLPVADAPLLAKEGRKISSFPLAQRAFVFIMNPWRPFESAARVLLRDLLP